MKKICITLTICAIILLSIGGVFINQKTSTKEYLRIHIRADSNLEEAQAVKYLVKDAVVKYLTPIIASIKTKAQAVKSLTSALSNIENVADAVLKEQGFNYTAKAKIKNQAFPTRVYNGYTLEQGFYDALIIELGSGKGDNWWCVVYPPLCFTGGVGYEYKSKIYEIIKDFFNKQEE